MFVKLVKMKTSKLLIAFLFATTFMSCNNNSQNVLSNLLKTEIDSDKVNIVFIVTDMDCMSCINEYSNFTSLNGDTIGLYYSKYPKEFYKKLQKVNSKIQWKKINQEIPNAINKIKKGYKGPYVLVKRNNLFQFSSLENLYSSN